MNPGCQPTSLVLGRMDHTLPISVPLIDYLSGRQPGAGFGGSNASLGGGAAFEAVACGRPDRRPSAGTLALDGCGGVVTLAQGVSGVPIDPSVLFSRLRGFSGTLRRWLTGC